MSGSLSATPSAAPGVASPPSGPATASSGSTDSGPIPGSATAGARVEAGPGSTAGTANRTPAAGTDALPVSGSAASGAAPAASPAASRPGPASAAGPASTPATPSVPTAGAKAEIVLGSLGTASGVIGAATQPIVAATKAWAADVNARGGLKGHPVRVVFGDDGGDPARAATLARKMVEQDKVIAFVGTYLVITTAAVTQYLDEVQVPMIGGPGGNEVEDTSPMVFNPQMGADESLGHGLLHNIVVQSDARKVATLYCREASSCGAQAKRVREFAALYGVEVVFEAQVSIAQPDYTGEVLAARNAGADAIITTVDEASIVRIARSAKRQGYNPVLAGSYTVNNDVLLNAGEDAVGILGFSATAPYGSSPLLQPYRDAVARFVPGARLAGYGSTAWTQGKLMERLADFFGDKAGPTTADVLEALYQLKDETLGGLVPPITFNQGSHGRVNRCMVPIRVAKDAIVAPLGDDRFVCARS
jgi:branched-chain amino acid transport system substrate-binding protein